LRPRATEAKLRREHRLGFLRGVVSRIRQRMNELKPSSEISRNSWKMVSFRAAMTGLLANPAHANVDVQALIDRADEAAEAMETFIDVNYRD